jgi:hypothetical protein
MATLAPRNPLSKYCCLCDVLVWLVSLLEFVDLQVVFVVVLV